MSSTAGPGRSIPIPGPRSSSAARTLAGQEHLEGGAPALALLHPGPSAVQLGEAGDDGQADPDAGGVLGRAGALTERLEDALAVFEWHPGAVVPHDPRSSAR